MVFLSGKLVNTIASFKVQSLSFHRDKFGLWEGVGDIVVVFKASSKLQLGELVSIEKKEIIGSLG